MLSSKARLSTLTLGRVYFWLFPLRTPPTHNPLAYSSALPQLAAGKIAASQQGFLFLVEYTTVGFVSSKNFKGLIRQIILAFCVLTDWNDDCHCTAEFVK